MKEKGDKMASNTETNVNDLVVNGVLTVVSSRESWTGTMTQLGVAIRKVTDRSHRKMLPGSPSALRVVLNRVLNRLRTRKVRAIFGRTTDHARTRYVQFSR
jgi:hypothetical protein